eukprot:4956507-Prymnesium_polylepis.1
MTQRCTTRRRGGRGARRAGGWLTARSGHGSCSLQRLSAAACGRRAAHTYMYVDAASAKAKM